jgi:hypothetical protein
VPQHRHSGRGKERDRDLDAPGKRFTAPMKALITAAMKPPPMMMPIRGSSQPAMTAPMMPTMMSPISPKPPPLTTMPASQPAMAPTISQMTMLSASIAFPRSCDR